MRLSRLALPLLLALSACSQRATPSHTTATATAPVEAPVGATVVEPAAPVEPEPEPQEARNAPFTLDATDGLPADLVDDHPLWESVVRPHENQGAFAMRIYADGRRYVYSPYCRTMVDGKPSSRPAPLAWRYDATIKRTAVSEVERLIREKIAKGILKVPADARRPELTDRQTSLTHRTWIDGVEYVIVGDADGNEVRSPLSEIDMAIGAGIIEDTYQLEQC